MSLGTIGDVTTILPNTHYHGDAFYSQYAGRVNIPLNQGEQLNLIGYSNGAVLSAQTALAIANGGQYMNHLVLIGAPIASDLLNALQSNSNIGAVHIVNLTAQGDPTYAGMSNFELVSDFPTIAGQFGSGTGHFYYAPSGAEGDARRADLANDIKSMGLK